MRKLILSMNTSLDGFVGMPNGEIDWIYVDEELFDYVSNLTEQADTAMYGRVTYQMMESYWPTAASQPNATKHDIEHSIWYNASTKIVISNTMNGQQIENTQIIGNHIIEHVQKLKQQTGKNILIFGSPSASHSLMQYNLIDEYWLFVNPILLGSGIPLFKNINNQINLKLVKSEIFSSGVIGLAYERLSR